MTSDLDKKIIKQIEYYFGDINLPRDKFLQEKIKEDEGWISLEVLLSFKRLASLSTDQELIAGAVEKSDEKLVEVSEDKKKLRRSPEKPLPEFNDERKKELMARTAYAKGFPADEGLDTIVSFLEPHGPIESCQRRTYQKKDTKETIFKGSCFIIFKSPEVCKTFIEAESIKYKDVELIRKWQEKYDEEKKLEQDKRRNKGNKKNKEEVAVEQKEIKVPVGAILQFSGIAPEKEITWDVIKEKVEELSKAEVSYIDFKRGGTDGYVRFSLENSAVEFMKTLEDGKLKLKDDVELTCKALKSTEEEEYIKKVAVAIKDRKMQNRKRNFGGKFNRKRKGHFMNEGPRAKK